MRASFVSLIANDRYQIGCTGQTVYVLDPAGNELAKFRDMDYAYYPALHPGGEMAAVYSNLGIMAVYSLSELRLIRSFRVSARKDTQTDRVPCFSPDGQYLYHIEGRKGDSLNSRLSVYSTVDWHPVVRLFEGGQKTVFQCMEFDQESSCLYLAGYFRKERGLDFFVARLADQSLQDVRPLDPLTSIFCTSVIGLKQSGFTNQAYESSAIVSKSRVKPDLARLGLLSAGPGPFSREYTVDDLRRMNPSLPRFWAEAGER